MDSKIIYKLLWLVVFFFSTQTHAIEFKGKFIQGHFIIGKTETGSKILIDMVNDKPLEDGAVIFENGIIVLSGNYEKIKDKIQPDAKIYDYKDKVIIPGLVDCHTHHNGFGDGRSGDEIGTMPDDVLAIQSAKNAKTSLYSGVTTIRENGPKNLTMMRLRDAVNDGLAIAPRMVLCGRPVAIIGGHMGYFSSRHTPLGDFRWMDFIVVDWSVN